MMTEINLPFPPSLHELFRKHNGKFISKKYKQWRDDAGWILKSQLPEKVIGPVVVEIILCAPDNRIRDADNYIKAPLDLLVEHGVIEGDNKSVVRKVSCEWEDDLDHECIVKIGERQ